MAAAPAEQTAPNPARSILRTTALSAALLCVACNNPLLNTTGSSSSQAGQPAANTETAVSQMSTAAAIRDAACYSDFELTNAAIEAKLSESIQNITVSGDVGENALRDEMILGLRFNANLQKRLAFDTLEECLR